MFLKQPTAITLVSVLLLFIVTLSGCATGGVVKSQGEKRAEPPYQSAANMPWGQMNPDAPAETAQFSFLIGDHACEEERRIPGGNEWTHQTRTWNAYWSLGGYAIVDTGVTASGTANGNVRIFDTNSNTWKVTFFSTPVYSSGIWQGAMQGNNMVLKQNQKAPGLNMDGFSRLTFSNISADGFRWDGEWVSADGSISYPFWRIACTKTAGPTNLGSSD